MVWSVPLVPALRIGEAFVTVAEAMTAYAPAEQKLQTEEFLRYLANFWGRIPEILSVAGHTFRTNNICGMKTILEESERRWRQLTEGAMILDQSRRCQKICRERKMQESQELLRTGQTVMADFLPEIFHPDEIDINSSLPDEPEAPDELPGEEGLANLKDPSEHDITVNSADHNWVHVPRQHPLLLKRCEKRGCYYLIVTYFRTTGIITSAYFLAAPENLE
ncbi:hypothetical protein PV328_000947 [Microctonus aethiopoides]|uniref:Uncharacterized protein n=1 Tax=Microctonus aethiopoides TaxID=144406 RepID=A0AA39KWZ9_9HYME|nr:hypothetical protein PV328_000947 [Microctonus aethiopoides]